MTHGLGSPDYELRVDISLNGLSQRPPLASLLQQQMVDTSTLNELRILLNKMSDPSALQRRFSTLRQQLATLTETIERFVASPTSLTTQLADCRSDLDTLQHMLHEFFTRRASFHSIYNKNFGIVADSQDLNTTLSSLPSRSSSPTTSERIPLVPLSVSSLRRSSSSPRTSKSPKRRIIKSPRKIIRKKLLSTPEKENSTHSHNLRVTKPLIE